MSWSKLSGSLSGSVRVSGSRAVRWARSQTPTRTPTQTPTQTPTHFSPTSSLRLKLALALQRQGHFLIPRGAPLCCTHASRHVEVPRRSAERHRLCGGGGKSRAVVPVPHARLGPPLPVHSEHSALGGPHAYAGREPGCTGDTGAHASRGAGVAARRASVHLPGRVLQHHAGRPPGAHAPCGVRDAHGRASARGAADRYDRSRVEPAARAPARERASGQPGHAPERRATHDVGLAMTARRTLVRRVRWGAPRPRPTIEPGTSSCLTHAGGRSPRFAPRLPSLHPRKTPPR